MLCAKQPLHHPLDKLPRSFPQNGVLGNFVFYSTHPGADVSSLRRSGAPEELGWEG